MTASAITPWDQRSLPSPENIHRQELANEIVVLSRTNPASSAVFVSGSLPVGGLLDPDEKLGLADFTAAALMRGTHSYNFQQIYDQLESIGASLGFSAGTHMVSFNAKSLAEDLDLLLSLLNDALRQPVFPTEQVERLRAQLLTSLSIRSQDTAELASLAFDELIYRDHPYRRPEDGYPNTIQAITTADLFDFHHQHYGPRGMQIAIVGGIDPAQAVEKVRAVFDDWRNPLQFEPPALPPLQPLNGRTTRHVEVPGKSQADLVIGAAGPTRSSPEYMAASIGNHIFGRFGMMGRLGESLREKAGIAYYVSSSLGGGLGPGPWEITAGVNPAHMEQAVELALDEISRFVREEVSAEELADSQANYIGRLPISLESNAGIASSLLTLERYQLGLDYYLRYPDLVKGVTPNQILEVAASYLNPEKLAIASAGSTGQTEKGS